MPAFFLSPSLQTPMALHPQKWHLPLLLITFDSQLQTSSDPQSNDPSSSLFAHYQTFPRLSDWGVGGQTPNNGPSTRKKRGPQSLSDQEGPKRKPRTGSPCIPLSRPANSPEGLYKESLYSTASPNDQIDYNGLSAYPQSSYRQSPCPISPSHASPLHPKSPTHYELSTPPLIYNQNRVVSPPPLSFLPHLQASSQPQ